MRATVDPHLKSLKYINRKHCCRRKSIQQLMAVINTHLCIHGLNCAIKFKWKFKNIISYILSVFLITLNVINHTYNLHITLFISLPSGYLDRDSVIFIIVMLMEFILAILFLSSKKKKMKYIIKTMTKMYPIYDLEKLLRFTRLIFLLLLLSDISCVLATILYFADRNSPHVFEYFGDNFVYGVIPAPH